MTTAETHILNEILSKLNSNSTTNLMPAIISGIAMLTIAIFQFVILKWVLKNDITKITFQLQSAKQIKKREEWNNDFKNALAQFLLITDPDLKDSFERKAMTLQIFHLQLLLSRTNTNEKEINNLVNKIALNAIGKLSIDEVEVLKLHAQLIDKSQELLNQLA